MRIFTHPWHEKYDELETTHRLLIFLAIVFIPIFVAANAELFGMWLSLGALFLLCLIMTDRWYFIDMKRKNKKARNANRRR